MCQRGQHVTSERQPSHLETLGLVAFHRLLDRVLAAVVPIAMAPLVQPLVSDATRSLQVIRFHLILKVVVHFFRVKAHQPHPSCQWVRPD